MAIPANGDFSALNLDSNSMEMLTDAYYAVASVHKGWDHLRRPDVPLGGSFMFTSNDPILATIQGKLTYTGHTGSSYGWVMRTMETIAKHGWEVYVNAVGIRPSEQQAMTEDEAIDYLMQMSAEMDKPYVARRTQREQ